MYRLLFCILSVIALASCRETRIHEEADWQKNYELPGIRNASFILRDHSHEAVYFMNKEECLRRTLPASTFKIFNSLVALETGIAPDDNLKIQWDGVVREMSEWNKDLTLREAFRASAVWYYQEVARRIGKPVMQHYLDTANYGNKTISGIDTFWLDGSLQISPDEQVGLLKRLYFAELPFAERTQRIVKSMMLWEDSSAYKLYYKTGWGCVNKTTDVLWVAGFTERLEKVKEMKGSMNNSDLRAYPYFFAQRFEIAHGDSTRNWAPFRIELLKKTLRQAGAI
ncbi:MAG: class D beta-lactamase [Sphingobacteriales bacterium]|nr:MAG: class D beta-lactamase [Sphingobacteriales bacterium]